MQSFAIIPAAGVGRRMGGPKLLLPWRGEPLIAHVLKAWRASRVDHIVAVVRADDAPLADVCRQFGAEVVRPLEPPAEMKISVALGLQHIQEQFCPAEHDAWLLAPADMPRLSVAVVNQVLAEFAAAERQIIVPTVCGRRGHPVAFPWPWANDVFSLKADEGVNVLRQRRPTLFVNVDDDAIVEDIDTPAQYRQLPGHDNP